MKEFFKIVFAVIFICISLFSFILLISENYKEGEYVMVYKVYYSNEPKTYTIKNDLPIYTESYRGTNRVIKIIKLVEIPHIRDMFGQKTVIESSAPIEVVSYTFKENK